jgi:DNA uptake protein ComE-like DNA-binding protein
MSFKKNFKTYFSFSSSERKSLIILLTILLGVFAYPSFVSKNRIPVWEQNNEKQKNLDSLLVALTIKSKDKEDAVASHKLFSFDPNQIDSSGLLSLGFSNYMAKNLLAYRKSGGNIAHKTDLKKIYGITSDLYDRLEPFVRIPSKRPLGRSRVKVELRSFDLNRVDSMELLSLGFSEFQTQNILRYRKGFGEFRRKEELKNVYGVDSSEYKKYERFILIESNNLDIKTYLFQFDPNVASRNEWDSLGVRSSVINRISKFLSKGGRFHKAQDLMIIYDFDSLKYIELVPYINIPKESIAEKILVDINTADSDLLQALPGIGSYFSRQIINYRKKLGGFYKVDQLNDIRGLRMSRIDSIRLLIFVDDVGLRLININKAQIDELNDHPYISYKEASDIIRLRKRKGPVVDLETLNKKKVFSKSSFIRVKPYLILE